MMKSLSECLSTRKQQWWRKRNWCKFLIKGMITSLTTLIRIQVNYLTVEETGKLVSARNCLDQVIRSWKDKNEILKDVHDV